MQNVFDERSDRKRLSLFFVVTEHNFLIVDQRDVLCLQTHRVAGFILPFLCCSARDDQAFQRQSAFPRHDARAAADAPRRRSRRRRLRRTRLQAARGPSKCPGSCAWRKARFAARGRNQ